MKSDDSENRNGLEIAVIGMACRFPGAGDPDEFWNNVRQGVESITFFSQRELEEAGVDRELYTHPNYVNAKGYLDGIEYFDAAFFNYPPAEATIMNPHMRLLHENVWHAFEHAGIAPSTHEGLIGVYLGETLSHEWEGLVLLSTGIDNAATQSPMFHRALLSTSISYKLNLRGPSYSVQTACSTTLVAIHLACQGLLSGDCDIAVAGGASITLPGKSGYIFNRGMIKSPDGHCRAFDENAEGTVFGNGVGTVVLRPLEEAITHNDHILAVILGSAINNDGNQKVGLSAPSMEGEAAVIKAAIDAAGIPSRSVGYIEAHGTGTTVGDPIEVEALNKAFGPTPGHTCAIGSVKTNIGHLDAASGVAGFIKTVLTLYNREIPASLHFEKPNRGIDFTNSPFYVNASLKRWEQNGEPLRAGVNSYGIGGTNAHIVLEEFIDNRRQEERNPLRPDNLIILSAKTKTALETSSKNLARYLETHPHIELADAAYTLQKGRDTFQFRQALAATDRRDAIEALSYRNPEAVMTGSVKPNRPAAPIVFMFPGQGSQYVSMAEGLYRNEPVFQQTMDQCFQILQSVTGKDFKSLLYPRESGDGSAINRTETAQPLIFSVEYALTRLLRSWGIEADAAIGHSIGEYTAACLAGVFSLESALTLVAARGELMQKLPAGDMMSIPLPAREVASLMEDRELALAAENSANHCVVSGPGEAVAEFGKKLNGLGIETRNLHTSHAFHSPMMEPAVEEFRTIAAQIPLSPPQVPFMSNETGDWITDQQAVDPDYWASHIVNTVRFAGGMTELLKIEDAIFLEVGPGRTLSTFAKQHPSRSQNQPVLNLIRHPNDTATDTEFLLEQMGRLWLYGRPIDWDGFHAHERLFRIPLPGYPFERKRYWVRKASPKAKEELWTPCWKQSPLVTLPNNSNHSSNKTAWIVFMDTAGLGERIVANIEKTEEKIITVHRGNEQYEKLFPRLEANGTESCTIIHLWNISPGHRPNGAKTEAIENPEGFGSLVSIIKHSRQKKSPLHIKIAMVSDCLHSISGETDTFPEKSLALGALTTIPQEHPDIECCAIDLPPVYNQPAAGLDMMAKQVLGEIDAGFPERMVAFGGGTRWTQTLEPIRLPHSPAAGDGFKRGRPYLITGGFGRIGSVVSEFLAEEYSAKLILTTRCPIPPREDWQRLLDHQSDCADPKVLSIISQTKKLESMGATVHVISADIADQEAMKEQIAGAEQILGPVAGVIHAAGDLSGASMQPVAASSAEVLAGQTASKGRGTIVLEQIFSDRPLDFMILMSSISSFLGGLGYTSYAAANIFMDHYTLRHNREGGGNWLSVNWDNWDVDSNSSGQQPAFNAETGVEMLRRLVPLAMAGTVGQIIASAGDFQQRMRRWVHMDKGDSSDEHSGDEAAQTNDRPELQTVYVQPETPVQEKVAAIWREILGFTTIGLNDDFFELGGDSFKAITIASTIQQRLNIEIPLPELFARPTIKKITDYIDEDRGQQHQEIPAVEEKECYPLSPAQKRLYILHHMMPDQAVYNLPLALELKGAIDRDRIERALQTLVTRHESLRTSFHMVHRQPAQRIWPQVSFNLEAATTAHAATIEEFVRPFDLSQPPLLRAALVEAPNDPPLLLLDIHHIISDGISQDNLIRDFLNIYNGTAGDTPVLRYRDYAQWLTGDAATASIKEQREFWLDRFRPLPPPLDIPADFQRPPVQTYAGSSIEFTVGPEATGELKKLAAQTGSTLYILLSATLDILLAKLSGNEDIVVGSPIAGRRQPELQPLIGVFLNTLAMRHVPAGEQRVADFLEEVKTATLEGFENQDFQFEELVESLNIPRDTSRNPLFDVMFIFQNFAPYANMAKSPGNGELSLAYIPLESRTSKFDLTFTGAEVGDDHSPRLMFQLEYSASLFKRSTVERIAGYFVRLLELLPQSMEAKIKRLELLSEGEKQRVMETLAGPTIEIPDGTVQHIFRRNAEKHPDHTALICRERQVSYRCLATEGDRIAALLEQEGIGHGDIVALMTPRSEEMILGIFAILGAGAAYLPLDPDFPPNRIHYILEQSRARLLLHTGCLEERAREMAANRRILNPFSVKGDRSNTGTAETDNPGNGSDIAYVIYTSGSTGNPKGVAVEHSNLVNFIAGVSDAIPLNPREAILALTTISFDIFVLETIVPLCRGQKVVLATESECREPQLLEGLIERHHIDIMQLTPSRLQLLIHHHGDATFLKGARAIMVGGEAFPDPLLRQLRQTYRGSIYNMYGPTETTVWSTTKHLGGDSEVTIGQPLANQEVLILDQYQNLQPEGCPGELYIGGLGVARGYLNNPALTADRFVFIGDQRFYKTGDLARWRAGGEIEFIGRMDHQVKIRGYRVELAEIEEQLLGHPQIAEAAVIAGVSSPEGIQSLLAYYVPAGDDIEAEEAFHPALRNHLARALPAYMIPSYFMRLARLPMTPNGKLDRNSLPNPSNGGGQSVRVAPKNALQRHILRLWEEILEISPIGITENFFMLGGHSLTATIFVSRLRSEIGIDIPLSTVFNHPTVEALAGDSAIRSAAGNHRTVFPVEKQDYYPQSSAQKRLLFLDRFEDAGTNYNLPFFVKLEGPVDRQRFQRTFNRLIRHQEAFRTFFQFIEDQPVQRILDPGDVEFAIQELTPQGLEDRHIQEAIHSFIQPFDLSKAPLLRVGLVTVKEDEHILLVDMHHIIADGTSVGVLADQITRFFAREELAPLPVQYKDFAMWQRRLYESGEIARQESYWRAQLLGEIPPLSLPLDFPRPKLFQFDGAIHRFPLDGDSSQKARSQCAALGVTLFVHLLTAFNILLHKYTEQTDILVGSVTAGRHCLELEPVVGMFVNTLVFRNQLNDQQTFQEFLGRVKENTIAAFDNQDVPFEDLVKLLDREKDPSRNPLFDVAFVAQNYKPPAIRLEGLTLAPYEHVYQTSKFDITLFVYDLGEEIVFDLEYATTLYKPATIEKIADRYIEVIKQILDNADIPIKEISISHHLMDAGAALHRDDGEDFDF